MPTSISARHATPDERTWAALAHGSTLLLGWGGLVPLIAWITQRQKSAFVAFHALQALAYQLLITVYSTGLALALGALGVVIIFAGVAFEGQEATEPSLVGFFVGALMVIGILGGFGLYIGVGVLGGLLTLTRRDFHYPLLGRWMRRYLEAGAVEEAVP